MHKPYRMPNNGVSRSSVWMQTLSFCKRLCSLGSGDHSHSFRLENTLFHRLSFAEEGGYRVG